jgi:hypothetical protein
MLRVRGVLTRSPFETTLALAALAVATWVVAWPLSVSRYPPLTDLPFHAADGSVLAHWFAPSFHFQDQFELHPVAQPYLSAYCLIGGLLLIFPLGTAVKIAVALHLLVVPAGLAVLFHGAKKSPLLGLLGLGLCWGNLTHWGFINYVASLGFFAMAVGATMLVVDRPTRWRKVGLLLSLLGVYFTHIYRYPFALAAVVGTTVVLYPATRRYRPILWPLLGAAAFFGLWWAIRPASLTGGIHLGFHPERLTTELEGALTDGFTDAGVKDALLAQLRVAGRVGLVCAIASLYRRARGARRLRAWDAGVTLAPLACAVVFLGLFVVMPMWIAFWWYVYPREATAATIILCGACPDLPRARWVRAALVAALSVAGLRVAREVAERYAEFSAPVEEFYRITRQIPQAPHLFYLIFDSSGTRRSTSPFVHLPAYVQAEKGGWLSYHFAALGQGPVVYRPRSDPGAIVPPRTPGNWEWSPNKFELSMTPFFDTFLVRQVASPAGLFEGDPTIRLVDHVGSWWLFRRVAP